MIKKTFPFIFLLVLTMLLSSWGGVGHTIINKKCTESFPASMAAFNVWSDSLASNASNADNRKDWDYANESPKHYIDIDNYPEFISTGRIASTYDSIVNIHNAAYIVSNGSLPWATVNMYDSLKVDFQKRKWHKAMLDASDLGHYVGDGHMPLHLTANFNGGKTTQSGIHSRYEFDMVGAYQPELNNYKGDPVNFVSNINKYIFDYIYFDFKYKDSVLIADIYAKSTPTYTASLWSKTHFTTMLFHNSSHSIAELIYTAWVEAGSPAFGAKTQTLILNTLGSNISVYPNPTAGNLNLIGDNILKTEVSSITGTLLGTYYDRHVNLSNLCNGMYILSIYGKEGLLKKEKVLVAK